MSKTKKKTDPDLRNDEQLDEATLDAALREAGLDVQGSPAERAARLEAHYLALSQPADWNPAPHNKGGRGAWHLTCEIRAGGCGYTTTAEQPFCVFCGEGKEEVQSPPPPAALAVRPPDAAVEGELIEDGEGLPEPDGEPQGTVADLDAAVEIVCTRARALEEGERSLTGNVWDLGCAIFDIFKRSLFVARKKDGGAPLYPSWSAFCKAELRMSSAKADRYMKIAQNFTRELAQDLGPSKLVELLPAAQAQAADEAIALRLGREPRVILAPLLEKARVMPVPDLRAAVKATMPAAKAPPARSQDRTAKATAAAAAKKLAAKKPEAERVTVQRQEGSVKLRFFQSEKAARDNDAKKAAKKFAEGSVAVEPAVNGVECVYTLRVDAKHGPVLHRKVVRVE